MEIGPIPFLNQEDFSYFFNIFQEPHPTTPNATTDISGHKQRKIDQENQSLKEILGGISSFQVQNTPRSSFDFDFQTPISNFDSESENRAAAAEMAGPELRRVRKKPPSSSSAAAAEGGGHRRLWVKERSKGWWDYYNSDECPDREFKKAFRMSKSTFDAICDELEPVITKKDTMLRAAIPVRQRVAVCLYRLATGDPLRTVSARFGLGISTCHKMVLEVCGAIRGILMPRHLQWPIEQGLGQIKSEFESLSGIPNVGGAIYTTHVSIIAPKTNPVMYFNKKHTERNQKPSYSTTVQGVVDPRGVFTDVCIGYPGSLPDARILEKSALSQRFNMGMLKDVWMVGHSGYPLTDWVLVPYTHQNLTWAQHSFNERVGDLQKIAKDAFMRLKGRWACLQKRTEMKLQELPMVLGACCVLHNICEMNNEEMDEDLGFDLVDEEEGQFGDEGRGKSVNALKARDTIAHNLLHHSHERLVGAVNRV